MKKGQKLGRAQRSHGLSGTPEFAVFRAMEARCNNPTHPFFKDYGGRGIRIHSAWLANPRLFVEHVGLRPSPKHEIDRIDNNKGYEPGNLRWATSKDQKLNRRNTIWIEHAGKRQCLSDWARELRLDFKTLHHRLFVLKQPYEVALVAERRAAGRPKILLTHEGKTLCLKAWAKELGVSPSLLTKRVKKGATTAEEILRSLAA